MKTTFKRFLMSAVVGLAVSLFFLFLYSFHVYYQELFQLFEFTGDYFCATVSRIGGFADWLSRFFTQFFHFLWAGTLIYVLVILAIQQLIFRCCSDRTDFLYAFSFIPAIFIWVFFLSGESVLSGPLAVILSLLTFILVNKIKNEKVAWIFSFVLVPILYFLLGSVSAIFSVLLLVRKKKLSYVPHLFLFAAVVFIASLCTPYPLNRLIYGLDYYKVHIMVPVFLWIAVGLIAVCVGLSEFIDGSNDWKLVTVPYMFALLLSWTMVSRFSSFSHEEEMKYQMLTIKNSWNKIIAEAMDDGMDSNMKLACVNLALAKTGHLGNHMFDFPQNGGGSLIPEGQSTFIYGLCVSEIYWQLGLVGQSARYAFETQSCVPDFQNSVYCFKRLAQTSIVNGKYSLAMRYLSHLKNTLFFRKWAEEQCEIMKTSAISEDPEYGWRLSSRFRDKDFMFVYDDMTAMLEQFFFEDVNNKLVMDYLLGWCLLTKDVWTFSTYCPFEGYATVPRAFQDAYLINWTENGSSLDLAALPAYISPEAVVEFEKAESPYLKYYYAK